MCVCPPPPPPPPLLTQKRSPGGESAGDHSGGCCWENIVGQELFKLNLTHMMADMATMGLDITRWLLPKIPKISRLEKWVTYTTCTPLSSTHNMYVHV